MQNIGFIGMGIMGKSMARNLKRAGFNVQVYNRSKAPLEELASEGFHCAASPAELAEGCDALLICVTDGEAVKSMLFAEGGACSASSLPNLVIDFSTISPADAKAISAQLYDSGIHYIDAPVSGGDIGAKNGTLTIMAGGETADINVAKAIFEAVGKNIFHTGEVGTGQLTKCVNQVVVANTVAAMTEGLALAGAAGLDQQQVLDVLAGGAAGSWSISNYGPRVLNDDLKPGFDARHMLKDIDFALSEAGGLQLSLPATDRVRDLYSKLCQKTEEEGVVVGNHGLIHLYDK